MIRKTAQYDQEYNIKVGNEFFPLNDKPVEIVSVKIKKQDHEYETRNILEQITPGGCLIHLIHLLFIWKEQMTQKSKTCKKNNYAKSDQEHVPKPVSDFKFHFLTVNI